MEQTELFKQIIDRLDRIERAQNLDAGPDLNRLYEEAVWDRRAGRFVKRRRAGAA